MEELAAQPAARRWWRRAPSATRWCCWPRPGAPGPCGSPSPSASGSRWPRPSGPCSWPGRGPTPWSEWLDRLGPGRHRGRQGAACAPALAVIRRRGYALNLEAVANLKLSRALSGRDSRRRALAVAVEDFAHEEYLLQELEEGATYRLSQISAPVFGSDGAVALALTVVGLPEKLTGEEIPRFGDALVGCQAARRVTRSDPRERPGREPRARWAPSTSPGVWPWSPGRRRASAGPRPRCWARRARRWCAPTSTTTARQATAAHIERTAGGRRPGAVDVTVPGALDAARGADAVAELGRLDVMANIAGIIVQAPVRRLRGRRLRPHPGRQPQGRVPRLSGRGAGHERPGIGLDREHGFGRHRHPVPGPGRLRHGQGGRRAAHPGARHRDGPARGAGQRRGARASWRRP